MRQYALRHNDIILKMAQNIFGIELIKDAFIVHIRHPLESKDISKDNLDFEEKYYKKNYKDLKKTSLNFDSTSIILEFNTGKKVEFNSSEWGFISLFDKSYIEL